MGLQFFKSPKQGVGGGRECYQIFILKWGGGRGCTFFISKTGCPGEEGGGEREGGEREGVLLNFYPQNGGGVAIF